MFFAKLLDPPCLSRVEVPQMSFCCGQMKVKLYFNSLFSGAAFDNDILLTVGSPRRHQGRCSELVGLISPTSNLVGAFSNCPSEHYC